MYFSVGELCRSNTADLHKINNTPNTYQKMNLNKLIDNVLDPIRFRWGAPIYVNSGFRSGKLNELIGGAKNSYHLRGMAADITVGNKADNKKLFELILKMGKEGLIEWRQLINEQQYSWIHISYNEDDNKMQVLDL